MAIGRDTTAANIKPLDGAIVRRYTCGATVAAGELVVMSSDGKIDPANTTSAVAAVLGVAVQGGADTNRIDVVVFGPVKAITGGTPGAICYASDTAGEPAESAGTNLGICGIVESATVIFVNPAVAEA